VVCQVIGSVVPELVGKLFLKIFIFRGARCFGFRIDCLSIRCTVAK
jgi:hypothetical protein